MNKMYIHVVRIILSKVRWVHLHCFVNVSPVQSFHQNLLYVYTMYMYVHQSGRSWLLHGLTLSSLKLRPVRPAWSLDFKLPQLLIRSGEKLELPMYVKLKDLEVAALPLPLLCFIVTTYINISVHISVHPCILHFTQLKNG